MRRKLSAIEHMLDINIVYFVRLEGSFDPALLRLALGQVQRKHPVLRALIREERDGLYYEEDCAPEIPLRILRRVEEDDFRRESQLELTTAFPYDQPQLRAVVLQSERESDLLLVAPHRICDGMSMLILVREVLRALHKDEDLVPYTPITTRDIIGDYQPLHPWKSKLTARMVNGFTRLIPHSRRAPENKEICLEWAADRALSDVLKQRCKAEGVSIHAVLVVALDRALLAVLGKKKAPLSIGSTIDLRRGRLAAMKSDMLFFGVGSLQTPTGQARELDFWARAREINEQIRRDIEKEVLNIPGRYRFLEMLRPLPSAQIQSIVRLTDVLKIDGVWMVSNLGNVVVSDSDAPFRVKDLRLYLHSFNVRVRGLVAYALNGEMRFYLVDDEKSPSHRQADDLKQKFMDVLEHAVRSVDDRANETSPSLVAVAE